MASRTENVGINIFINGKEVQNDLRSISKGFTAARNEARKARIGSKEYIEATKKARQLKGILDKHRKDITGVSNAWTRVKDIALGFVGGSLITSGFRLLGQGIKNAVNVFKTFEKQGSALAAVLGKTRKETKALTDDAKRLGSITSKTASDVTALQTAYARLGFSQEEILKVTEGTIAGSDALQSELSAQADLVGGIIRAYGKDAKEAGQINDVLAKSAASSALSFEKLNTAVSISAPAANAANVSFERQVAILGTLADRNIDASTAGTGLRNILLDLSEKGLSWEEAMQQVRTASDQNAKALELFGKRGATLGVILANNEESTNKLETALNSAAGTAQRMADTQLDNLEGSLTLLQSAWEGFILSLEQGDGVFAKTIRGVVDLATAILGGVTSTGDLSDEFFRMEQETINLEKSINPLVNKYDELKSKTELNKEEQAELDSIIQSVAATVPTAISAFDEYGNALDINSDAARNFIKEQQAILKITNADAIEEQEDAISGLSRKLNRLNDIYRLQDGVLQKYNRELAKATNNKLEFQDANADEVLQFQATKKAIKQEIDARNAIIAKLKGEKTAAEEAVDAQNELEEATISATGSTISSTEKAKNALELLKEEIANARKELELQALAGSISETTLNKYTSAVKRLEDSERFLAEMLGEVNDQVKMQDAILDTESFDKRIAAVNELAKRERQAFLENDAIALEQKIGRLEQERLVIQANSQLSSAEKLVAEQDINAEIEALTKSHNEELERIEKESLERRKQAQQATIQASMQLLNNLAQFVNQKDQQDLQAYKNRQNERQLLNEQRLESGIINRKQFEAKNQQLNKEVEDREKKLRLAQFERNKELQKLNAIINTATAVTAALASGVPPPGNFILAGLVGAAGAIEIATISKSQPPEFREGGILPGNPKPTDNLTVFDEQGREVAKVGSGEPIISLSSYRANKQLIDTILANEGESVQDIVLQQQVPSINFPRQQENIQLQNSGSLDREVGARIIPINSTQQAETNTTNNVVNDNAELVEKFDAAISRIDNWQKELKVIQSHEDFNEFEDEIDTIKTITSVA